VLEVRLGKEKWRKLAIIYDGGSISPPSLMTWVNENLATALDSKQESTNFQINLLLKDGNGMV
jgi:hypothetical protein